MRNLRGGIAIKKISDRATILTVCPATKSIFKRAALVAIFQVYTSKAGKLI
ncbi:MAG: hypothetical protein KME01_15920 [Chroococcus sp. CMT-3BRIN-NPC107]|jgi:hypothetical protein|nr:hypothetical protein [Chroococcus sp. CMT-3BRIN-NPC107]